MRAKNGNKLVNTITTVIKIGFYIATVFVLLFLVIGQVIYPDERAKDATNFQEFNAEWQQILEDGSKVAVAIPGKIKAEHGEVVTITTTLPSQIAEGEIITIRAIWQDVDVYIDGKLRESYNTVNTRPFGRNSAFRYIIIKLEPEDAGKELVYQFCSNSKYTGVMRTFYIGDELSLYTHLVEESGMKTITAILLMLMSLFCIIACAIFKWRYKKDISLNHLAWTIFLCALWLLSEVDFRQLFIKNVSVLSCATYWSLMLMPFSLALYMNDIQNKRYGKLYIFPFIYSTVVLIVGTLLQIFDIQQFVQQLPFIHGGILFVIVCIMVTIMIDGYKRRLQEYLFVGIGLYGMLIAVIMELGLYYMGSERSMGTFLALGMVFLLIMAIFKALQDLIRSEKRKQQAITAREAQAKFLANMSHEIRTPINAVIGMNEMVLRENNNEVIQEYAHNIQSASKMLLGLVNDILDFSKIESGQLELMEDKYELGSLIRDEILLLNERASGKPIEIQVDIDEKLPSVLYGDELRIKQVITNLVSNAVKYTKEGKVILKVYMGGSEHDVVKLCFSVIDTGIGIKQEDLVKLFDSFRRLDISKNRNIEGTGLGLNIAKQIVDLMNGNIIVESEYGNGSTFTVAIPQRIIDNKPLGNSEDWLDQPRKERKNSEQFIMAPEANILIVDDNAMNLSVVQGLLKRTGAKLDLASSGRECLELTKNKKYDIILMDHMMPEMDGVQALHMLRADSGNINQNTIVIALTANAVAGCREMYLEYGFNDYISKPIEAKSLENLLLRHLPRHLVHVRKMEMEEKREIMKQETDADILFIDRNIGLPYCMNSEEFYKKILATFCKQGKEYSTNLEKYVAECNWEKYAVLAHTLKGNALNIGASNFSKLSLQHELAAKEKNIEFLTAENAHYIDAYRKLLQQVENMV